MLLPGMTIENNRVVAQIAAGVAVDSINAGIGIKTTTPATNTYNSGVAQTETVPNRATRVVIELVGPGGNGGAGNSLVPGGGGGGGGAYVLHRMNVSSGQTFTYTVGTAGVDTTVIAGTANPGVLRAGSGTNGADSAAGGAAGTGGAASGGLTNTSGSNGTASSAGTAGAGGNGASPLGGAGAASPGTGAGTAGTAPGGGGSGSGSASAAAGGAGAAGRIVFTYFVDKLAIDTNAVAGNSFDNGFAQSPNGALYGTTALAGTDDYQAGLRRSAAGALVYVVGAPTQYSNGNPVDANGALACI